MFAGSGEEALGILEGFKTGIILLAQNSV